TLTDNSGRPTDFRHTILIMTSNVGAYSLTQTRVGFGNRGVQTGEEDRIYKNTFSPEFRNRLDARVRFTSLSKEVMGQIVDKFVRELGAQLADRNVTISLSPEARAFLADEGYDPQMGARPLARVIDQEIKRELSNEILFGKLEKGGRVRILVEEVDEDGETKKKLAFEYDPPSDRLLSDGGFAGRKALPPRSASGASEHPNEDPDIEVNEDDDEE